MNLGLFTGVSQMKKAVIIATIISAAAVLGACRDRHEPLKVGALEAPATVEQGVRQ
jgi:hypothetical protein